MKTKKYYHNLYFKCGVLLLADMSESLFERTSSKLRGNAKYDKS